MAVKPLKIAFPVLLASSVLLFSSCGEPYFRIASANQNLRQGNLQKALSQYLAAEEQTGYPAVSRYNRGNSYYFLGEREKAVELWAQTAKSSVTEARFRGFFNRGVVYYQEGEYEQAADYFLAALEVKPDSLEAKLNLEYSVRGIEGKNERKKQQQTASVTAHKEKAAIDSYKKELLQMISESEKRIWESKSEETGTPSRDW